MSGFGDDHPDDAVDVSAPNADPEQVAIRIHEARIELGEHLPPWSQLSDEARAVALAVVLIVVAHLRREGTRL